MATCVVSTVRPLDHAVMDGRTHRSLEASRALETATQERLALDRRIRAMEAHARRTGRAIASWAITTLRKDRACPYGHMRLTPAVTERGLLEMISTGQIWLICKFLRPMQVHPLLRGIAQQTAIRQLYRAGWVG